MPNQVKMMTEEVLFCMYFFYQTSAPLLTKSHSFFQYTLNVVLLIFIIIMESFSQPVSWTKVVCPRDREGKRFSNPPADAAYYSHRSKTSSFDAITERRIWRPWGHSGHRAAPRLSYEHKKLKTYTIHLIPSLPRRHFSALLSVRETKYELPKKRLRGRLLKTKMATIFFYIDCGN